MKAIYNINREVLGIGENIADGNTWCEITSTEIPARNELIKWGCLVYTIDEQGVLHKRSDEEIKQQPSFNEYQSRMRAEAYKLEADSIYLKANEYLYDGDQTNYNLKMVEWKAKKTEIRNRYPYYEAQ